MTGSLRRLVSELRRRHVFKVAAGYAVVGWIVIQAAQILVPNLLLPEWLTRAVIVLVILGFPIAVVLAWAYDVTPEGIRATADRVETDPAGVEAPEGEGRSSKPVPRFRFAAALVAITIVLAGAGAWFVLRGPSDPPLPGGEALLARLDSLAAEARYAEAFDLAARAAARGDSVPSRTWARLADRLTVITEPAGARVRALRLVEDLDGDAASGDWTALGQTPLHGVSLPRGDYLLRIERDGFAPVERIASTGMQRAGVPLEEAPETFLHLPLLSAQEVPEGMVFVPGGPYAIASRNLQGLMAELGDFFLDRHMVTNADFAAFIDAGGYADRSYWEALHGDPAVEDADTLRRRFVDRTGLPGPRDWSGQAVRPGQANHPVTGVSWYEAAAYCAFRDARLPTFHEWEKAARDGRRAPGYGGVVMPWGVLLGEPGAARRANFLGTGTAPVDAHPFGLSPYGAYDMGGNAKEWMVNLAEDGRAVTGGSWEDPIYVFSEVGSMAPSSSSAALGFRCARGAEGPPGRIAGQGEGPLPTAVETPVYEPVDDAAFRGLLSHYVYDRRPSRGDVLERVDGPGWTRERLRYEGPGGDFVLAYLYLPTASRAPHQTLVFVPGADLFFGARLPEVAEWLLGPIIRSGRAVFTVVMEGMTERPFPPGVTLGDPPSARFRDQMVRHATEMRMGIDYLETREELNLDPLVYVGFSWGAGSRLGFAAVEPRFGATVFVGGGIDERVKPTLPEADNVNFAPRVAAPVLLLNGREDEEHPWLTRALPLWEILPEPRELVLIDGAGHVPPVEDRVPAMLDFLDRVRVVP